MKSNNNKEFEQSKEKTAIYFVRNALGLSQEEFGKRINIKSRAHISSLENGDRKITDRIISDIVRVYHVNREWLLNGTGEMFKKKSDSEELVALVGKFVSDKDNPLKESALLAAAQLIDNDTCFSIIKQHLTKLSKSITQVETDKEPK